MASPITDFNDMMEKFINDLQKAFPKEGRIKKFMTSFDLIRKTHPRKCLDTFMGGVAPYSVKISSKDETFITQDMSNIEFIKELNINDLWASSSPRTKETIWQYIQILYMLGSKLVDVPKFEVVAREKAPEPEFDLGQAKDLIQNMLSNPAMLQGAMSTFDNPSVMEEATQAMNNPDLIRQATKALSDPVLMEQIHKLANSIAGSMKK